MRNLKNIFIVIVQLIALFAVSDSVEPVEVSFLKAVARLNNTGVFDYYFSCSVVGRFLQWQFNGDPLTGFQMSDEVGRSFVRERYDFGYTGTLLSTEPANDNLRAMVSIIVVSFHGSEHSNFYMICSNGSISLKANSENITNVYNSTARNSNDSIILDYIITSHEKVLNMSLHIFICGANYSVQQLQTNGRILAFRANESLGIHRAALASAYTVIEQGILIAKSPFMTTSILIVADNSDVDVSCFHGTIRKTLRSNKTHAQEERSPSITPPVTSTPISMSTPSLKLETDPMTTIEDRGETMLIRITDKPVPVVKLLTVSMIMIFVVVCISIIIGAAVFLFCKLYAGMRATNSSYPETVQAGGVPNVADYSVTNETSVEILLNYVISSEIVEGTQTHIFICGVNKSSQLLQANGPPLSFESSDELGDHRVGSIDTYSVYEQGIFIARNPFTTTSIFIVTVASEVKVTCLYRTVQTSLYSNMSLLNLAASIKNEPTTHTPTPDSENIMSDDKNVESTSQAYFVAHSGGSTETLSSDIIIVNRVNSIIIVAPVMSVIIIIIVITVIVAIFLLKYYISGIKNVAKTMPEVGLLHGKKSYILPQFLINQEGGPIGKEENKAGSRDTLRWRKKPVDNKKIRPSIPPFQSIKNSFIKAFDPHPVQVDQFLEVETSRKVIQVVKGDSGFTEIPAGRISKKVYIRSDGKILENAKKSEPVKQDRPNSFWGIISDLIRLNPLRRQRKGVKQVYQVQDGSAQFAAITSGHEHKSVYVNSGEETFTPTENNTGLRRRLITDGSNFQLFEPAEEATEVCTQPDDDTQRSFRQSAQISLTHERH